MNRAIGEHFQTLGSDAAARDALRILRVPGSINPLAANSQWVKYWIQANEQGGAFTYTLDELACRFQ